MFVPGEVISYLDMCNAEGTSLQKGMNFRFAGKTTVILMSLRKNAPYNDRVEEDGRVLIYEGHDIPKHKGVDDPKRYEQPMTNPGGTLTENGKFFNAAEAFKKGKLEAEIVKVYEKIKAGIWVYNGLFMLVDAWQEESEGRKVFKFKLELTDSTPVIGGKSSNDLEHNRLIPSQVKLEVWKRDTGKCVTCGSNNNLHFDHIIPFSKGGSSILAENIQLLCARHNLEKRDKIE